MSNRVGGRFAQEATMYISVNDALIEKLITLEGQAESDPATATASTTESDEAKSDAAEK